jgi:hypothetical protein
MRRSTGRVPCIIVSGSIWILSIGRGDGIGGSRRKIEIFVKGFVVGRF